MRVSAFAAFRQDVERGQYPAVEHIVQIADAEYEKFVGALPLAGT